MDSLKLYEIIVQMVGELPPTLEWVYGLLLVLFLFLLFYLIFYPFIYIMTWRR